MHSDFDQHGIGCMKLFAQVLLRHSWALSPNECWPFCFFIDDDVTQFKKWSISKNGWEDISLYQLLIMLEQRIPIGNTRHVYCLVIKWFIIRYCNGWIPLLESA